MRLSARNPMRSVLLSILVFEVLAFALAIPVMVQVSHIPLGIAAALAGSAALLALVAAGLLHTRSGYPVAWLAQLGGIALGGLTPAMFVVGLMFSSLWVLVFVLGRRLDQARTAR